MPEIVDLALFSAEKDMGSMDGIALPIAILVLWFIVKSGRLLLIPLVNMCASAAMSFGSMYLIGLLTIVEMSTSSIMMSILIAMSVDYSLFLLTRFREELLVEGSDSLGAEPHEAIVRVVSRVMETAGATILLSGSTLTCSFLVVAVYPVEIVSSMGVGCALALALTLYSNLTLTPVLIATFPEFFVKAVSSERLGARVYKRTIELATYGGKCFGGRSRQSTIHQSAEESLTASCSSGVAKVGTGSTGASPDSAQPNLIIKAGDMMLNVGDASTVCSTGAASSTLAAGSISTPEERRFWWCIARCTTRLPFSVILLVLVLAASAAVGYRTLSLQITASLELAIPRDSAAMSTYKKMDQEFGQGFTVPYRVLIAPPAGGNVTDESFWTKTATSLAKIQDDLKDYGDFEMQFMNYQTGYPAVPFTFLQMCREGTGPEKYCHPLLAGIEQFSGGCQPKDSAMYGFVTTRFDPAGVSGKKFFDNLRRLLDEHQTATGYTWALTGNMASSFDLISAIYGAFPSMIIGTMIVAFVSLAISFRSIMIPIRSLMTIAATLSFVYGASVLVFQDGILDWMGFEALHSKSYNGAVPYLIPVVSFPVVVGICLDYDIFLLTRASEFRSEQRMAPQDAVQHGLVATGWIITAAGIIMAIAFGGLLFSSMGQLNVLSFYMVVAVLFDTFIVRTVLAPPAMSLLGRFLWWPNHLSSKDLPPLDDSAQWHDCDDVA
jgi:uncharacterized membrane protein YdfJ with MMPL/SSD domain